MALSKRRSTYIDFTKEGVPFGMICSTAATPATATVVATGADTTATKYLLQNGQYLEVYNDGATTVAGPTVATTGWTFPTASGAFAHQIGEGGVSSNAKRAFVIGTDPGFFVRCKFKDVTLASNKAFMIGFRKAGDYVVTASVANLKAAYDDKFLLGTVDAGTNWLACGSVAGVDADNAITTPTSPLVAGTSYDVKVMVSSAGVVSATVNDVAVVMASTYTFTDALSVVPIIAQLNITSGAACDILYQEYQCGYTNL